MDSFSQKTPIDLTNFNTMSHLEQGIAVLMRGKCAKFANLDDVWNVLRMQSGMSNKIEFDLKQFRRMDETDKEYLEHKMMNEIQESVRWVQDQAIERVWLCANSCFQNSELIEVPGRPLMLAHGNGGRIISAKPIHKKKVAKIPRPCNSFILYRKQWHETVKAENPGIRNADISKIIGFQWQSESDELRASYKADADLQAQEHARLHPDYQYGPRKPSQKKKRMTKATAAALADYAAQLIFLPPAQSNSNVMRASITNLDVPDEPIIFGAERDVLSARNYTTVQEQDLNSLPWDYLAADFQESYSVNKFPTLDFTMSSSHMNSTSARNNTASIGTWTSPPAPESTAPTGTWNFPPAPESTFPPAPESIAPTGTWTFPPAPESIAPTGTWTFPPAPENITPTGTWTFPPAPESITPTGPWTFPPAPESITPTGPWNSPPAPESIFHPGAYFLYHGSSQP